MMAHTKVIETKQKIINTARELFLTKGYQTTSINDIIKKMGISKGAFYHHFTSKDELLDAITSVFSEEALVDMLAIKNESIDALAKLNKIFSFSRQYKSANKEMVRIYIDAIYNPSNFLLLEKLKRKYWEKISSILIEIVKQGRKEGLFNINNVEESVYIAVEMIFGFSRSNAEFILKKKVTEGDWEALQRLNDAYVQALERLLGSKTGTFKIIDKEFIDMFRK
jgi:AcrR family transcriptional regulator